MKLSTTLEKALNDQLNLELTSAYAYLGMAAYFERTPFTGFGQWMHVQSGEEVGHANRFFKYIVERGGKLSLQAIAQPKADYKSPLEVFQASLGHEQRVSASICAIYELATAEKDYATLSFLKWFLDEQVEEERNVGDMLAKLQLVGDNSNGLYQVDRQAAMRAAQSAKS
jgi:ferritin